MLVFMEHLILFLILPGFHETLTAYISYYTINTFQYSCTDLYPYTFPITGSTTTSFYQDNSITPSIVVNSIANTGSTNYVSGVPYATGNLVVSITVSNAIRKFFIILIGYRKPADRV